MTTERPKPRAPFTEAESYNVAVQLHNQEFRTLGERTMAFLIVQSILVAAFVTILTIPPSTMKETLPYAFYPFASGIIVVGISYCFLQYLAGRSGSQAAFRWRQYMRHIENNHPDTPWNWFYADCQHTHSERKFKGWWSRRHCERCLLERPPLPSSWLISPAIFLLAWACAIIYIFLRCIGGRVPLNSALAIGTSIFIFLIFLSLIIWRCLAWWRTRNLG